MNADIQTSETPRTDENILHDASEPDMQVVEAKFARALEKEVNQLRKERNQWYACAEKLAKIVSVPGDAPIEKWATIPEIDAAIAEFERLKGSL